MTQPQQNFWCSSHPNIGFRVEPKIAESIRILEQKSFEQVHRRGFRWDVNFTGQHYFSKAAIGNFINGLGDHLQVGDFIFRVDHSWTDRYRIGIFQKIMGFFTNQGRTILVAHL